MLLLFFDSCRGGRDGGEREWALPDPCVVGWGCHECAAAPLPKPDFAPTPSQSFQELRSYKALTTWRPKAVCGASAAGPSCDALPSSMRACSLDKLAFKLASHEEVGSFMAGSLRSVNTFSAQQGGRQRCQWWTLPARREGANIRRRAERGDEGPRWYRGRGKRGKHAPLTWAPKVDVSESYAAGPGVAQAVGARPEQLSGPAAMCERGAPPPRRQAGASPR